MSEGVCARVVMLKERDQSEVGGERENEGKMKPATSLTERQSRVTNVLRHAPFSSSGQHFLVRKKVVTIVACHVFFDQSVRQGHQSLLTSSSS
jgi:hypothetical protein